MRKIIGIALFLAASFAAYAQKPVSEREYRRPVLVDDVNGNRIYSLRNNINLADTLQLNDEQHEKAVKLQIEMQQGVSKLDRQLREKQVQLQALEKQFPANMKSINKNIDEQAKLIAKQMKLRAGYNQKIRSLLNEEQRKAYELRGME